jgi:copper chaperone CopZ
MCGEAGRAAVQAALEAVPGVRDVVVSLYRASAEVRFEAPCQATHLVDAVASAGCEAEANG